MSISDELSNFKKKYAQKEKPKELTPCDKCKQPASLATCIHCTLCGRQFDENGNLVKEAQ